MPDFTPDDLDISPSEFVYSCNKREIGQLIETLVEDGHLSPDRKEGGANGIRRPNINDQIFWDSLDNLAKCRDLLSIEEETYINKLAERFKHLR